MVTTQQAKFTRADYMALPEGFRAELLDGVLVKEPAPTVWHQVVVGKILQQLVELVGLHRAVTSPIDVFVDDHNILQPDVLVLSEIDAVVPGDKEAATPVLVVEVLSPSTATRDRNQKVGIYLGAGVREVWLIDPASAAGEIHRIGGVESFTVGELPVSRIVPGFTVDLARVLET